MPTIALLLVLAMVSQLQDTERSRERQVQAAVLDSLFIRDTTLLVVIGDSTISGGTHFVEEDYQGALKTLGPLPEGLQIAFERARRTRQPVDSLPVQVRVVAFGVIERAQLLEAGRNPTTYWSAFYSRFPHSPGWVELSRPGISRDGNTALLLAEYGCGGQCGGTRYILLHFRARRWHVVKVAQPRIA
jgi:hypothetical protein